MWMSFKLTLPLTAWLQWVKLNKLIPFSVLLRVPPAEVVKCVCSEREQTRILLLQLNMWLLSTHMSWRPFDPIYPFSPPSFSPPGSRPLPVRKPTRPSGTETGWMLSWTGWPACCHSPRMSSLSWTSCLCCALQCPTSASRVSSKVNVKSWHL